MGNIIIFSVPLPCLVSDWSAWSNMDATGMSYRTRMVTRPPINIDGECPPLIQSRKGNILLHIGKKYPQNKWLFDTGDRNELEYNSKI